MRKTLTMAAGEFSVEGAGQFFEHIPEGVYRDPNIDLIRRMMPRERIFYDIGANIGLVSLGVSDLAQGIIAVEPSAETYQKLKANTAGRNVTAVQALIGRSGESRVFLDNTADPTGSASLPPGQNEFKGHAYLKPTTLTTIGLDALVAQFGAPAFIKIDVEGAEVAVLESGTAAIRKHEPSCLIEFNALTLMNFGRINPPEALAAIKSLFPHVYRVAGEALHPVTDDYAFIVQHVLARGCVDDLFCTFSEASAGIDTPKLSDPVA